MKTKFILSLIFSVCFALMSGTALAVGAGLPVLPVSGVIFGASFIKLPSGVLPMAVQKEIWMNSIVEGLFADNSFLSKAFNADEFVTMGKVVHIPNAGLASGVVKNRVDFPASVSGREDTDLTFNLDEFTTNPIRISNAETIELSYSKRDSALRTDRAKLIEEVSNDFVYKWSPADYILTTGTAVAAHLPSATGYRKRFTKDDVKSAMDRFNAQDIPQTGRYMLVDAVMYGQLINSMTTQEAMAFHASVNIAQGVLGKLFTFDIMMRSKAGRYTNSPEAKEWTEEGVETDNGAAIAWHVNSICRAQGEVVIFDSTSNPLYYGDIYSFLVRAGGRPMRNDVAGLLAIVQDTAEIES